MEMERINENTIRVLIENEDLEERGVTFLDLLGNRSQIESFFYSILEEVDIDEQFQETDAVTFQVLPNRNGLELFISKNIIDPEEEDFAELAHLVDQDSFNDFVKKQMVPSIPTQESDDHSEKSNLSEEPSVEQDLYIEVVLQVGQFENFIQMAHAYKLEEATTNLYEMGNRYYVHVLFSLENMTEAQVDDEIAALLEFGVVTDISPEVLEEYGELLMENSAFEQANHFFN